MSVASLSMTIAKLSIKPFARQTTLLNEENDELKRKLKESGDATNEAVYNA